MNGLSQSAERSELLVHSIKDYAIYMLDPAGIVTSWNPGAEQLKGYSPDEIIGQHFSRFYTEGDRARGLPDLALATALAGGRYETEGWRVRKDGTRFWASATLQTMRDPTGAHLGFAKITRDLSERKAAEEALRQSEERFRLLVQGVTDYAIYMLDTEGRVSSWNAGAERFKGYAAGEIIGEHFSRFYTPEDLAAGIPRTALQCAEQDGRFEAEGWRVRKDGTRFWASVVIDPIRNDDGQLLGFTKITRDLTERKRAQEEIESAREQFFQLQKMEAIGQLTGGVAHDFNNILAAILGSLNIARRRLSPDGDVVGFIDNAITAAERGATLTQRMLAFARKQDLKLEPVDLETSVGSIAEMLQRTIGPGIAIRLTLPPGLPAVQADRGQLELALMNLVVNARDAMPSGGTIHIDVGEPENAQDGEEFVRLSVIDAGEGMDPETLTRAADPFFTTKGIGKGTGLGLSMVRGMVEQCGGRFWLDSEVGQGTRAHILLKAVEAAPSSADPCAETTQSPATRLRILAVDDDAIIMLNTVAVLEEMGHEVVDASSGAAALRALESGHFDLMITDFAMPGMTGAELAEKALALDPGLRIILASGYATLPEGMVRELPRLTKPFSESELAEVIARTCGST